MAQLANMTESTPTPQPSFNLGVDILKAAAEEAKAKADAVIAALADPAAINIATLNTAGSELMEKAMSLYFGLGNVNGAARAIAFIQQANLAATPAANEEGPAS